VPAPADVFSFYLAENIMQFSLLDRDALDRLALGAAMLIDPTADQPLRSPGMLLQYRDGPVTKFRAQMFPWAWFFSIVSAWPLPEAS